MSATLINTYACLPTVKRGESVVLGGDPKGENFLYASGTSIVIRNIREPRICELYNGHPCNTTVAAYAPSGYYIASGDSRGFVKIWATDNEDHPIKFEGGVIAGPIRDICWSEDSKRVCCVGSGRGSYGRVFMWDSGNSVGEITGQAKGILSADIKPTRPYRLATGGEDNNMIWLQGPPFKFNKTVSDHSRFVTSVRFSPNGENLVTVGLDKKIFLYDGKTGDKKAEFTGDGHKGGIYGVSWSPDSSRVLTASADKSCKIWDVATGNVVTTFAFSDAPTTEHQQLGCLWQGDYLLSVALNGHISYLDPANPSRPTKILKGHNKYITAIAKDSENRISTASFDGVINRWDSDTGLCDPFEGAGHTNQVIQMKVSGDTLISGGMDDSVRFSSISGGETTSAVSTDSPVKGLSVSSGGLVVAASMKSIMVIRDGATVCREETSYEPASIALSPDESTVAVGGSDNKVHIYSLSGSSLSQTKELDEHRGPVGIAAFSPDGAWFAAADLTKHELKLFDTGSYDLKVAMWVNHRSRINDIAWTPDSKHIATCDLAQDIYIWSVDNPMKKVYMKGAHRGGTNGVAWLDDSTLASTGQDCCWRTWTIEHAG